MRYVASELIKLGFYTILASTQCYTRPTKYGVRCGVNLTKILERKSLERNHQLRLRLQTQANMQQPSNMANRQSLISNIPIPPQLDMSEVNVIYESHEFNNRYQNIGENFDDY